MSHILMLCHDQHLDRRITAQANSLIQLGHQVTLLALSHHAHPEEEITPESIKVIRIGLKEIVPENTIYKSFLEIHYFLKNVQSKVNFIPLLRKLYKICYLCLSKLNWCFYRVRLLCRYQNLYLSDPLPFHIAFVNEGKKHLADLIQVHDLPTLEAGITLASQQNIPLVYDAHELYPEQRTFSKVQRRVCHQAEHWQIKKAAHVFAVNNSIAKEMSQRYGIPLPTTLLNAIDPPQSLDLNQNYKYIHTILNLDPQQAILLFQGGYAPYRNLESLIEAMALIKIKEVVLVLMGFGGYEEKLKERAKKLKLLNQRIYFIPAVPQSELLQYTASATVGIIPYTHVDLNSYYCTPNKLFEYIQAGLPILANNSPELKRFVLEEDFGLVHAMDSPRNIAKGIEAIFRSGKLNSWKQNILEKRKNFSWQSQSQYYLEVMSPLLEKSAENRSKKMGLPEQTDIENAEEMHDEKGVPFLNIKNFGIQYNPGGVAVHALAYAGISQGENFEKLKDLTKFSACIEWLIKNLKQRSTKTCKGKSFLVWEYQFDNTYNDITIPAPWISTFAQAVGIQALLASYRFNNNMEHLNLAREVAKSLFIPIEEGGLLFKSHLDVWFEEIPSRKNPSHILNGHMRALLALEELIEITQNEEEKKWFQRGVETLYRWLPRFNTGYWFRYDLNPRKKGLLFRIANSNSSEIEPIAIHKITLRDPCSDLENIIQVGVPHDDTEGDNYIAGIDWGQSITFNGRSARFLYPKKIEDPESFSAPYSYFYCSLPNEWQDNLRTEGYELMLDYYDNTECELSLQLRSIAPGKIFQDIRNGTLLLNGEKKWCQAKVNISVADLGYWVGTCYAKKHRDYLYALSVKDKRFIPWAEIADHYLEFPDNTQKVESHQSCSKI